MAGTEQGDPMSKQAFLGQPKSSPRFAIRRQNETFCATCVKVILMSYCVILVLVGLAAAGFGIAWWVEDPVTREVVPTLTGVEIKSRMFYQPAVFLLILGGFALVPIAVFGCLGTLLHNRIIIFLFMALLALVLVAQGTACGLAFSFYSTISEENKDVTVIHMKDTLTKSYGLVDEITEAWDSMQSRLGCCGAQGNTTSRYSWLYYGTSTEWYLQQMQAKAKAYVPESCCVEDGDIQLCQGQKPFNGPPLFFNNPRPEYQQVNPYLYTTGCTDKLFPYLEYRSRIVAYATLGLAAAIILGLLFTGLQLMCMYQSARPRNAPMEMR